MMEKIKQELEKGGAVVLPTETVYGLFAKALDEKAVDHVYRLKRRPRDIKVVFQNQGASMWNGILEL